MRGKESESGKETEGRWKWVIGKEEERGGVSRLILAKRVQWYRQAGLVGEPAGRQCALVSSLVLITPALFLTLD